MDWRRSAKRWARRGAGCARLTLQRRQLPSRRRRPALGASGVEVLHRDGQLLIVTLADHPPLDVLICAALREGWSQHFTPFVPRGARRGRGVVAVAVRRAVHTVPRFRSSETCVLQALRPAIAWLAASCASVSARSRKGERTAAAEPPRLRWSRSALGEGQRKLLAAFTELVEPLATSEALARLEGRLCAGGFADLAAAATAATPVFTARELRRVLAYALTLKWC